MAGRSPLARFRGGTVAGDPCHTSLPDVPGQVDGAVDAAVALGLEVVPGACPLMFLEPTGFVHRFHRAVRRARGQLTVSAA